MRPEAQSVALERAMKTSSDMFYGKEVPEGLNSDHSPFFEENAATAFETARVLNLNGWDLDPELVVKAINNYRNISGQRGRAEFIPSPTMGSLIVDCAHNYDGIKGLMSSLNGDLHIIFGAVGDKDPTKVLSLIPQGSKMYWCKADISRAMPLKSCHSTVRTSLVTQWQYIQFSKKPYLRLVRPLLNPDQAQAVVCGSSSLSARLFNPVVPKSLSIL